MNPTFELCPGRSGNEALETVISSIPGVSDRERILIVLCQGASCESHLEMRQQSWSAGIGWFTQNTIQLATEQVDELRYGLAAAAQSANHAERRQTKKARQKRALVEGHSLRVLQADSA
jgi:hypothetical protein